MQLRLTGPAKLSVAVRDTVKFAELPTWIVAALGAIVPFRVATKSCAGTLWLRLPLVPVIVIEYVPLVAEKGTDKLKCADPDPGAAMLDGLKLQLTPLGTPVAESAMAELNPPEGVTVMPRGAAAKR